MTAQTLSRKLAQQLNRILRRGRVFIPPTDPQEIVDRRMVIVFRMNSSSIYDGIYSGEAVNWREVEWQGSRWTQIGVKVDGFNLPKWVSASWDAPQGFSGCTFVRFSGEAV